MARYTGPTCRLCRRLGEKLTLKGEKCSSPRCPLEKRNAPPGGRRKTRRRISDRAVQLQQKQKIRFSYGVLEKQFRRFFVKAMRAPGITAENLLILMERRLDNVVYRLGFADSRSQARQIVRHGHILVNEHRVDIPSYLVESGDVIIWRGGSTRTKYYKGLVEQIKGKTPPNWLSLDEERMTGNVLALPSKDDIDSKFDGKAVVEYYSR